jgi:hypothetical protein
MPSCTAPQVRLDLEFESIFIQFAAQYQYFLCFKRQQLIQQPLPEGALNIPLLVYQWVVRNQDRLFLPHVQPSW